MKVLPEIAIQALKLQAARETSRDRVHPEDMKVYDQGLYDGTQITAEFVISQLQDAPVPEVPVIESESE
jgi:hypothetical protein